MFRRPPMVCSDALSGHLLPWIPKNSPQSRIALVIKKAIKTPKLNTIWLELIARVLNMLIGLKGDNYYSKEFKRVNYKLSNSTFWVVITDTEKWWLWTMNEMMALNVKVRGDDDDSEHQIENMMMMALNTETENATRMAPNTDTEKWWLWTPNEDTMMALNVKMKQNRTLNAEMGDVVTLDVKWRNRSGRQAKMWLWTPILRSDGSERRTKWWLWTPIWECDFERQTEEW